MFHNYIIGLLLGWGASVPIGPVNIEIIRRNLQHNIWTGICFGLGAGCADLIYLVIVIYGMINVFNHPLTMKIAAVAGSCILISFALLTLYQKPEIKTQGSKVSSTQLCKNVFSGLIMTIFNPYTLIFWISMGTQFAILTTKYINTSLLSTGSGVITGILSWVIVLNIFTSRVRHMISEKSGRGLNIVGAIILFGFAVFTLFHAFY